MVLLADLDFSLPLKNPVIIFSLVLFIILFAPILLNKIKVPHLIGLIVAGVIVGPYGFNLLLRDSSIVLFGTVGLLYIMFMAGLEIDLAEFNKNKYKSLVFGLFTFAIPMLLGVLASYYLLQFSIETSVLLSSMFASHTLLAYPIASRYGISGNKAITITIGGTMITDTLALLVLAVIVGMAQGDITPSFWITLSVSVVVFACIVLFIFPVIARWFFKKYEDSISQYIFVLAMVFMGGVLAEAAGIEPIIGAFLSGLALNKFIPHNSALMNRIGFVGNAIFIPFFLVGVGMLVDVRIFFHGIETLKVAGVMIVMALAGKFIAAWITQKTFRLSRDEKNMIFGLSSAQAAATLAAVLVGYNIILGEAPNGTPIRLLNEDILNGTIIMILVTCTVSSFIVEKASRKIALTENENAADEEGEEKDNILISIAYPDSVDELVNLALSLREQKSKASVHALHVVDEQDTTGKVHAEGKKMMDAVMKYGASMDKKIIPLTRFDQSVSNGIVYTIKEKNIKDLVIGLHKDAKQEDFIGHGTEQVLTRIFETVYIYKAVQPFNTLKRIVVTVTPKAESEAGFCHWFTTLSNLAKQNSLPILFYASPQTIAGLEKLNKLKTQPIEADYKEFTDWNDFLILSREVEENDLFIIVSSRNGHVSFNRQLNKLPYYLSKYFIKNSFIILYPAQLDNGVKMNAPAVGAVTEAGNFISKVFKRNKRIQ
ncbi:cation:proton antiporter [Ginsengibacter hankyongi]|uniref:Cation:proton antiporter n=1 Tax=Ginsengibacter hankyongi TaxID=2607284 RepID=A0A5J5IJ67_9BACT|nr:cation:proton antiporter [Ginsengibacter hankyongi]KAA9038405.1 cation:proton antiporter [Ginsengibacter hankyongi]